MPWWERDPAQLATLLRELRASGFRVRQGTDPFGRLQVAATKAGRRFRITAAIDAEALVTLSEAVGATRERHIWCALGGVRKALEGLESAALLRRVPAGPSEPVLLHPSWINWSGSLGRGGRGILRLGRSRFGFGIAALGLTGVSGSRQATAAARTMLAPAFPVAVSGLWARAHHPDEQLDLESCVRAVERELSRSHGLRPAAVRERLRVGVGALLRPNREFPQRDDWLFVRRSVNDGPVVLLPYVYAPLHSDAHSRAPYTVALRPRRVLIVGCGAMGWTVATQLARSGVREFALFDDDSVGGWNLSRLGASLGLVGVDKVHALAAHLESIAADIRVRPFPVRIGEGASARALIAERPDLIIDVTADPGASDHTNLAALALGVPALYAWVSQGVVGARIVRVRPYESACYECLREARPPRIRSLGDVPRRRPEDTWDGALFDVEAVAAAVVRIAVLTLASTPVSAQNPDHVVMTLRGVTPRSRRVRIDRDPACRVCGDDVVEVNA
jgi:molybdopterin/thiamine biosynthesis adenylyltransferase